MATVLDSLSTIVQEELPMFFEDARQQVDPTFQNLVKTSEMVESDNIGRNYVVQHRFRTSISGHIERAPLAEQNLSAMALKQAVAYQSPGTYPSAANMTHSGSFVRSLALVRHKGNFSLPTEPMQHSGLSPLVLEDIAEDLKGLATRRAQMEATSFYAGNNSLGSVDGDNSAINTAGTSIVITPENCRLRWFMPGMMLNMTTSAGVGVNLVSSSPVPLVVDAVDLIGGTITLSTFSGVNLSTGFDGATDLIETDGNLLYPWAASLDTSTDYKLGHFGLEDWIKNSGEVMDMTAQNRYATSTSAFSLTDYPQFKSLIRSVGTSETAAPLTEKVMMETLGIFTDAYDTEVDTLITTRGVMQKFLEQPLTPASSGYNAGTSQSFERNGQALDYKAGFQSFPTYTYDGKVYNFVISPYCKSGTLYGMKMKGGNLKRYVPKGPATPAGISNYGIGSSEMNLDGEIRFINPLDGKTSIFSLTRDSNGQIESRLEAPFDQFSQVAPIDIRGIKLQYLSESATS